MFITIGLRKAKTLVTEILLSVAFLSIGGTGRCLAETASSNVRETMCRSSIQRIAKDGLNVLLAILAAVSFLVVASKGSPAHAAVALKTSHAKVMVSVRAIILVRAERISVLMEYTVLTGNTLSGIAQSKCGSAGDWTGIYDASRKVVGNNPNLILPGQRLTIECSNKSALPRAGSNKASSKGGSYGHPYFCGDGDGDGWDMPCATTPRSPVTQAHSSPSTTKVQLTSGGSGASGCSDPSGHLSASQMTMLWLCAGGPAWAVSAALRVATCESGWNTRAFNPSGASGLWQILGQVVGGYIFDAHVNALNAVAKFKASGDTWAQWVCKP